jgi:glyoxylase-like metal-dependent hydrolase (beta-lactamase superfamily II)
MSLSLYALTCGHIEGEFGRLMEGGEGKITVPIPVFLIEHPKGRALFDTGLHPDCQHDAAGRLGRRMTNLFKISFCPGEEVSARLEAMDRDPARIDLVINSHFHFDHVGGNALIPNATMVVQCREWDASMDPDIAMRHGFNPRDFDLGHKLRLIDGEHDVFGDGSVVCMPTHGHTPGHQSLRIRLDGGEVVLAADACYFCQTLRERRLPRYVHDREAMLASLDRLEALEKGGARIFFGHDPEFWRSVPQAVALGVQALIGPSADRPSDQDRSFRRVRSRSAE